jgi:hypothetical protein
MTTFEFTSPDGKTYEVEGPVGSTPQQAFEILQKRLAGQKDETPSSADREGDEAKNDPDAQAPPVVTAEHGPWENYRSPASVGESRFKVDPGGVLSAFEAAVLEEVLNTPLSELLPVAQRICTEAEWHYGPTMGNA